MILITGSTGFVGSYLIPQLAQAAPSQALACLVPATATQRAAGARLSEKALVDRHRELGAVIVPYPGHGDAAVYRDAFKDLHPVHGVIYMAANNDQASGFEALLKDNVGVLEAFVDGLGERLRGKPFFFTSSVMAAVAERLEPRMSSRNQEKVLPYGRSKLLAERALSTKAKQYGFTPIILRLGSVYGDRSAAGLMKSVDGLAGLSLMAPIPYLPGRASVIHVTDVARLLARLVQQPCAAGVYNADDASPQAIGALVEAAAAKVGKRARLVRLPGFCTAPFAFLCGALARAGVAPALSLWSLLADVFVTDDVRVWPVDLKPLAYKDVHPVVREAQALTTRRPPLRVAVLGGNGFIGGRIVRRLVEQGYTVRGSVRGQRPLLDAGSLLELLPCDAADMDALTDFLQGQDAVIFAAGLTTASGQSGWKDYLDANVGITLNLIQACRQAGVKRLVYLGSQAAHPAAEGRYGVSKHLGELAVQACDLDWLLLKPGQVIGAKGLVNTLYGLSNLLPVFPVLGGTPANLELVGVDEIAAYIQTALEQPDQHSRRTVQLGSSHRLRFDELLGLLWTQKGKRPLLVMKLPRWFFAVATKVAAVIGIRVPLTNQVLDGIYTPLPEYVCGRECDDAPEVVLGRYL